MKTNSYVSHCIEGLLFDQLNGLRALGRGRVMVDRRCEGGQAK